MHTQPLFSVIIPTYNRKALLRKAVDSVLSQTYGNLELIIVDDGSFDDTDKLISNYQDKRIVYKKIPHSGVSAARNKGISLATGNFIAFLDSDDWWKKDKLEITKKYITDYPKKQIFHTQEIWYRGGVLLSQKKKHRKPDGWVYEKALSLCCISISTACVKKGIFSEIGIFDESLPACEDYDFWLRATLRYPVKLIDKALTLKDGGRKDQLSSSVWGLDRFRIKAIEKILRSEVLTETQKNATVKELKKKCLIFAKGAEKHGREKDAEKYLSLFKRYET